MRSNFPCGAANTVGFTELCMRCGARDSIAQPDRATHAHLLEWVRNSAPAAGAPYRPMLWYSKPSLRALSGWFVFM